MSVTLSLDPCVTVAPGLPPAGGSLIRLDMIDGICQTGNLQAATQLPGMPPEAAQLTGMFTTCHIIALVLRLACRYTAAGWMLKQIVNIIASHIQTEAAKLPEETGQPATQWAKRKRADRDHMEEQSLAALAGHSKGETTRSHLKLCASRYFAASVEALSASTDIAIACDATSLGGKNTLATVVMDTSTGICVWAPPQAPYVLNNTLWITMLPAFDICLFLCGFIHVYMFICMCTNSL